MGLIKRSMYSLINNPIFSLEVSKAAPSDELLSDQCLLNKFLQQTFPISFSYTFHYYCLNRYTCVWYKM